MKPLPRGVFERTVAEQQANKYSKGFERWHQLVAMIYAQLCGACSLRTVVAGFNAHAQHHYHLGMRPLRRSTLADANQRVSPEVFVPLLEALMGAAQRRVRQQVTPFLRLLDSTSFTLKGPGFDAWTASTRNPRTQGLKLHVSYDPDSQTPQWIAFSPPNVNDIDKARELTLEAQHCYVFDKGYTDYAWWHQITEKDALFVTRFKSNAALQVKRTDPIPSDDAGYILADQVVRFRHRHNRAGHTNPYDRPLRRITVARPDHKTQEPLVLATNDMESPARVIAERYKARWGIELFFKWIKQHLRLRRFLGRSQNAVKLQIVTALIAYLLVAIHRHAHASKLSPWEYLAMMQAGLFQRPHLEAVVGRRRRQLGYGQGELWGEG